MDETPDWVKYAKAGDKVVCISGSVELLCVMTIGEVYQILDILHADDFIDGRGAGYSGVGISLEGHRIDPKTKQARYFHPKGFRPLVSKLTESGMSTLRSILNGKKVEEGVEA